MTLYVIVTEWLPKLMWMWIYKTLSLTVCVIACVSVCVCSSLCECMHVCVWASRRKLLYIRPLRAMYVTCKKSFVTLKQNQTTQPAEWLKPCPEANRLNLSNSSYNAECSECLQAAGAIGPTEQRVPLGRPSLWYGVIKRHCTCMLQQAKRHRNAFTSGHSPPCYHSFLQKFRPLFVQRAHKKGSVLIFSTSINVRGKQIKRRNCWSTFLD